jgi:acetyl-CoA acetyltransferase
VRDVYVAGVGAVPVRRFPHGWGRRVALDAGVAALRNAGCTYADVTAVYGGVASPMSPRTVLVAKEFGLTGATVQQVVNASASGLAATHEAILAIRSGVHDAALVIGYDVPERSFDSIGAQGYLPPVSLFAMWAQRRMLETGTRPEHLAMVAAKNWNNARSNPYAMRQADHDVTADEVMSSKMVAPPLTSMMSTPWCLGAAAVVLASKEGLRRMDAQLPIARIAATVGESEVYGDGHIFEGAIVGPPSNTERAVQHAFELAGVGAQDLDLVQVHDAFAIEELVYNELIGLSQPGDTEGLLERGAFGPGSKRAFGIAEVSFAGGLIGRGHPGGATGTFELVETVERFRASDSDRLGLCQMLGAGSVCFVQILERIETTPE